MIRPLTMYTLVTALAIVSLTAGQAHAAPKNVFRAGAYAMDVTPAFGPLLVEIRKELSAAMIVIEHDMPMIMALSDRVYCLEAGSVIATGTPAEVRADPRVVASYLGTDERAIARSDS